MGSLRKRGKKWYACWTDAHGRRRSRAISTKKSDAEAFLAMVQRQEVRGKINGYKPVLFADAAREYIERVAIIKYKRSTYENYVCTVRIHLSPAFGDTPVGEITTHDVDAYAARRVRDEGAAPGSVNDELAILGVILKKSMEWGYATSIATRGATRPKVKRGEISVMSPSQARRFLAVLPARWRPLYATAIMTGMRAGELAGLLEKDVDFEAHQIHVRRTLYKGRFQSPKTEKSVRSIDLPPTLEEMLSHWLVSEERPRTKEQFVVPSQMGRPLNMQTLAETVFQPALAEAGIPRMRLHDLRHTYASLLIANGESLKYVQEMMGHTSIKVTVDTYGHLLRETHTAAAKRLDDAIFGGDQGCPDVFSMK